MSIQKSSSFVIRFRAVCYKDEGLGDLWQIPSASLERQIGGSELMTIGKKYITKHGKIVRATSGEEFHQKLM